MQLKVNFPREVLQWWFDLGKYSKKVLTQETERLLKLKLESKIQFAIEITFLYRNVAFFPSEELRLALNKLGINNYYQKWLVDLNEISLEIQGLEQKQIVVYPEALIVIKEHLDIKIFHEMIQWIGYVGNYGKNNETSRLFLAINNFYRRKTVEIKQKRRKSPHNEILENQINAVESIFEDPEEFESWVKKYAAGNTKPYYKLLVEKYITPPEGMPERQFYCNIYGLIRLIAKDVKLYETNQQVIDSKYYDNDWNGYRYSRIRHIVYGG